MQKILSIAGGQARAARSVHLGYTSPDVILFHNELIVDQSTPGSFFMVCGWNVGYFGIQELANRRKVILFSVWDTQNGERVECLYQSPAVSIERFGNEGTGGKCIGSFDWKIGETNRFVTTATIENQKTIYSGYVQAANKPQWERLVTFRRTTNGQPLKGLYSFIEDFRRDSQSASEKRHARFGNGWVKGLNDDWVYLNTARFTASNDGREAKDSIDAGLDGTNFFLMTGGTTQTSTPLGSIINRNLLGLQPPELQLP